ncbi:MAG: ribulose-phosphate 3-epimerase [Clostridiales bacterium]|nr:ribulose-phosphate 3-epimerase [Clostridiales bacterium]
MEKKIWDKPCIISPSLITLDLCNLETQVRELEDSGIEMLHVDLLDGYFSPSMPIGLDVIRQLRKKTSLEFDVHLMANSHDYFVDELLDIGVQQLVFHGECEPHIDNRLNMIRARKVRTGLAMRPATSLESLDYVLEKCDTVLLMLINPGYASSKAEQQVEYADRKIRELRSLITERGLETKIEIDGRVSPQNIKDYGRGIVDIFVAGSTCIQRDNISESVQKLFELRKALIGGDEHERA